MIKDEIVRLRLKKRFREQKPHIHIGKVKAFTDFWVVVDGVGVMLTRNQADGAQVDKQVSRSVFPRDNIESIRVLPSDFDYKNLKITTEGQQIRLVVDGAEDAYLGELGEG